MIARLVFLCVCVSAGSIFDRLSDPATEATDDPALSSSSSSTTASTLDSQATADNIPTPGIYWSQTLLGVAVIAMLFTLCQVLTTRDNRRL